MIQLDQEQKKVVDCNSNAVVSAGAGSGKTTVLAARFLRLIKEGRAEVSEILTLTFTRKAAAEMYQRIYKLILEEKDNKACRMAIEDFDKASISTLDSFCGRIARDCSVSVGIPSNFSTDEDAVRALAEKVSLDFVLRKSRENKYMQDFIYINGFERVWKDFFVSISLNYLSIGSPRDFIEMYNRQKKTLYKEILRCADTCFNVSKQIAGIDSKLSAIIKAKALLKNVNILVEDLKTAIEPSIKKDLLRKIKKEFSEIRLSKACGSSNKPETLFYKELVDEYKTASESIIKMIVTLENDGFIKAMFQLTSEFQVELFEKKRSSALLSFNDVLTIAVNGLKLNTKLRKFYKSLFKYIMIDEFQDNNLLQKELLYLLSEKNGVEAEGNPNASQLNPTKLFFVGDEKQSIYRFRGADVSVFKQLSVELERAGGVSISLKRNYRSEPDLIHFFNKVFSQVMIDNSSDYQASFVPLESRDAFLKNPSNIKILYKGYEEFDTEEYITPHESEAHAIANFILESKGQLEVSDSKGVRFADFSDFAILFRSGSNQKYFEQVFRAKGIPYSVHSVRSLFQEAPVNDIYNLLQICLYPEDRFATAAFLRSPLCNLSDVSVIEFLLSNKPLFAEGQEACCKTDKDIICYQTAKELFNNVLAMIDINSMVDVISYIWYRTGYRYLILHDSSLHAYLEHYDYFIELAKKHDKTLASAAIFLDSIRENLGDYKKIEDVKVLGYSTGGVEIMPVHQSKGLEFPIVIIANMGNSGVADKGGSAPAYISPVDGLSFNIKDTNDFLTEKSNFFYSRGVEENSARELAELRRLLYVALTRAENHLVLSGVHGRNNQEKLTSMLNIFLSSLGREGKNDPLDYPEIAKYLEYIDDVPWVESLSGAGKIADIKKVQKAYKEANVFEYSKTKNEFTATELNSANTLHSTGEITPLPKLALKVEEIIKKDSRENSFGTLCHLLIEQRIKKEKPTKEVYELLKVEIRRLFKLFKDSEWDYVYKEASRLSDGFFNSELWLKFSEPVSFASEMPFTALQSIDGVDCYINGVIDLVIETENMVQIIDFKTDNAISPGEYNTQMDIYLKAAEGIFSKPAQCSLFYLRGGIEIPITKKQSR